MIRKPCFLNLLKYIDIKCKQDFAAELAVTFFDGKLGFDTLYFYYQGQTFYHF